MAREQVRPTLEVEKLGRPCHTHPRYRCSLSGLAGFTFPGRQGHISQIRSAARTPKTLAMTADGGLRRFDGDVEPFCDAFETGRNNSIISYS
jgi:hypothetical protein